MSESCAKYTQIGAFFKQVIQAFDLILMNFKLIFPSVFFVPNSHQFLPWLAERRELRQAERGSTNNYRDQEKELLNEPRGARGIENAPKVIKSGR